jgi:6-pyruvoyltetrahydropterin/6-carboxytetrahydropterin synthase
MFITREFSFDAAHFLSNYYGKCERMHGHTYKLQVTLEGDVAENGMVMDFVVLKRIVKKQVLDLVDHQLLNDVLDNPSAERLVMWMWERLVNLPMLLQEEVNDPNLAEEIKVLLQKGDAPVKISLEEFGKKLRLVELKLWETPNAWVTYHGK